jgi:Ca2+-binding RTX toxin-like protein
MVGLAGYDDPVLGIVGAYEGGYYKNAGIYRPTLDPKMRSLNRPFDPIAREAFILMFYAFVDPLDGSDDNAGEKFNLLSLNIDTIDPDVIVVDWTIDGVTYVNAGEAFDLGNYGWGSFTITARAYDPTPRVRGDRSSLEQSVTWTVTNDFRLVGTSANETLAGNDNSQTIVGLGGNDTLFGLGGDDVLDGGAGNDVLDGGTGADQIRGGLGDDTYYVDNAGDAVTELPGEGADTVLASITYTLGANVENLTLTGTADINGLGNNLANTITGNSGANALNGFAGDDILVGAASNDTLYGGEGDDT